MSKRKSFTLDDKLKIIKDCDDNPTMSKVDLAKMLDLPVSSLKTILAKREEIQKNVSLSGPSSSKKIRVRQGKFADVETALVQWFGQARAENLPVSGPLLAEKAREIGLRMNVTGDFSASAGWLHNFKKRHGITSKKVCGESSSVDVDTVSDWKENKLLDLIRGYEAKDIFNADETGLFFNLLPDRTLAFHNDTCHGAKRSKERITVMLCVNADGSEKLPPLVIGKTGKPHCFKNVVNLPTKYTYNKKAWMTSKVFEDWVRAIDAKMGAQHRKIVLFIDNASSHPQDTTYLRNVNLKFFPANCTSQLQPLDLGIIKNMKDFYKKLLLNRILQAMTHNKERTKRINILQAMRFVAVAWSQVKPLTIEKCFKKAGFVGQDDHDEDDDENQYDIEDVVIDIDPETWEGMGGTGTVEQYLRADEGLITGQLLSINEIVDDMMAVADSESDDQGSDDEVEENLAVPKFTDAMLAFEVVERYVNAHKVNDEVQRNVTFMHTALIDINEKGAKQSKISDFFKRK